MRPSRLMLLAPFALIAACGSDKTTTNADSETGGNTLAPTNGTLSATHYASSKMVQQATTSTQSQADQSETATSGSDDASGTNKSSKHRGGEATVSASPGVDFTHPLSGNFNVTLDFNAYIGPNACTQNGNLQIAVRSGNGNDHDVIIEGSVSETYEDNHKINQSTEPNIMIAKKGTRGGGRVVREIKGLVRRTLTDALDPNDDFNFLIDHNDTVVTDLYVSNTLSDRTINGRVTVTDTTNAATAKLTFANVGRPSPATCLCPTSGSITVAYTSATKNETTSHTFSSTCGQIVIADVSASATATVAAQGTSSASGASSSTTASSDVVASATATSTVTWKFCTPE